MHSAPAPEERAAPAGSHAFIVEDDVGIRSFIAGVLTSDGFSCLEFNRMSEMEGALAQARPELIVLDLTLTGSDGVEALRSLASARFKGKILLVSGHSPLTIDEVQKIGERHGLAMLPPLHKPFRVDALRDRLSQAKTSPAKGPADLETALQNNWLELWYQPKIDLGSMLICGAEALIRLRHPERGLLQPGEFLPAPGDPLYRALTDFVVRRALTDWSELAAMHITHRLAVNVPASILQTPDFVDSVRRHLPRHEKFPGLIAEITEVEAIDDLELARETAVQLRLYNVHVAIDDFGAGHSTLARLSELPFSELKLDRKFVSGCAADATRYALCKDVAELAHRSNIVAVAEGVESKDDLNALIEMGYDVAQGFIFAKPMPRIDFIDTVRAHAVNAD